ncbi:MAG TPA: LuxR C-terminal-related transcriptional regulator [Jiangellaceae bacterium]
MVVPERLTRRERATLSAIERRLSNAEIAGEFGISVRTVESHIAALRRKLGAESRAALIRAARDLRGAAVPVPNTSFVGRGHALDEVRGLLDRTRWVTIVGPAGAGKTRLALEVAVAHERAAVVAELEHAMPEDVSAVVARCVGVSVGPRLDPVEAIGVVLSAQPHTLVLDNVDRVVPAARAFVRRVLVAAPALVVLATSRAPLGDSGETVYALPPLDTDGPDSPAQRLFVERAQAARPGLRLTGDELASVGRICQRLDGLPLAIELAAARVRHLNVHELDARLGDGLDALERAGGGRHDTLEAAFEWTWNLLDEDERSVLSRLAALPRTFDIELAEAVTTPGAGRIVLRLLDRSLIVPAIADSRPEPPIRAPETATQRPSDVPAARRFRLLDVVRRFVLARTEAAVIDEVRNAHLQYHVELAEDLAARARTDDSTQAIETAFRLYPEMGSALTWAVEHGSELALRLARAVAVCAEQYGPEAYSVDALGLAARDEKVRASASATDLTDLGRALCYHDLDLVGELSGLALGRIDGPAAELAANELAGVCGAYRGRRDQALAHLAVAERRAVQLEDHWRLGGVHQAAGIARADDPAGAIASFQAAIDAYARAGDAMHVNNTRYLMARAAAQAERRPEQVVAWAQQCVDYATEKGNAHELAHALLVRASVQSGADAESDLMAAIGAFQSFGDLRCLARSSLALSAVRTGDERLSALDQALNMAERLHDDHLAAQARAGRIAALWQAGDRHGAAAEFGSLLERVGADVAEQQCPPDVVAGIAAWPEAVAEGRARAAARHT